MTQTQATKTAASAEHHNQAAECCTKAAEEHLHAAKSFAIGDHKKAGVHAKNAQDQCTKAQDHGKRAVAA